MLQAKPAILYLLLFGMLTLSGCARQPPANVNDICDIFEERKSWYGAADLAERKWNIPASQILAFMYHESSFNSRARPPRKKLFGFIPWQRPSSAFGYAQATKPTWEDYKRETGHKLVFRTNFKHAADFIGWYNNKSVKQLKLKNSDAYNLYLAYHEGRSGYRNGAHKRKPWLLKVANKVQARAKQYDKQLRLCRGKLKKPLFNFF